VPARYLPSSVQMFFACVTAVAACSRIASVAERLLCIPIPPAFSASVRCRADAKAETILNVLVNGANEGLGSL